MKKKKGSEPVLGTKKQRFEVLLEDMYADIKVIAEESGAHTKRFDVVDARFDKVDTRLDSIETNIAVIKIDL